MLVETLANDGLLLHSFALKQFLTAVTFLFSLSNSRLIAIIDYFFYFGILFPTWNLAAFDVRLTRFLCVVIYRQFHVVVETKVNRLEILIGPVHESDIDRIDCSVEAAVAVNTLGAVSAVAIARNNSCRC